MEKFKRGRLKHIKDIRHIWHRRTESEFLGIEIIFTLEETYIKEHLLEDYINTYYNDCDDELKDSVRENVLTGAEFIVNICLDNIWAENIQDFSDIVSISAFDFDIENDIDSMLVVGEYEDVFDKFIFLYSKALLYKDLGMILNLEESKEIKDIHEDLSLISLFFLISLITFSNLKKNSILLLDAVFLLKLIVYNHQLFFIFNHDDFSSNNTSFFISFKLNFFNF